MVAVLLAGTLFMVHSAFSTDTVIVQSMYNIGAAVTVIEYSLNAASGGSYSNVLADRNVKGLLFLALSDPSTLTAPTANWDYSVVVQNGLDAMGNAGLNRSATVTEIVKPLDSNGSATAMPIEGRPELRISSNSNSGAGIIIKLFILSTD